MRTVEKESKRQDEVEQIQLSTAIFEDSLVEQVWSEGRPAFQIHKRKGSQVDLIVDAIEAKDDLGRPIKYVPADNEHLRKGSVIIPECNIEIETATFEQLWKLQDELLDLGFDAVKQREEARLIMRIVTSSWFLDKEESGIAGMGKFAPIIPIRGLSGGGKNRFLNILRWSSYHPFYQLTTNKIPSIYRPLELWKGVLCLDECDLDAQKDKELVAFLLARSYGNPISRQNPNDISESNAFNNFQISILTQRENFGENALESRSIPFYAEKSWKKLPTIETPKMIELGKEIQKISLALRMRYWDSVAIDKSFWLETSDARLNSALLPLAALSKIDSDISELLNKQLAKLERRKTQLKAESDDGLLANFLFQKLQRQDGELPLFENYQGNAYYFLEKNEIVQQERRGEKSGTTIETEQVVKVVLTTSSLAYSLGFNSAKAVRKKLDSLLHTDDLPTTLRVGGRVVKPVWFRVEPLLKLFREFVLDFDAAKQMPDELKPKEATLLDAPHI